jgi:hypothetical protein
MKTASKVLNVLGILLLTLQVLGHLLRIDAASPDVYGLNAVMYYIGLNLFAIFGLGFLCVSLYLKRKIRRRDYAILADSIGVAGNQDWTAANMNSYVKGFVAWGNKYFLAGPWSFLFQAVIEAYSYKQSASLCGLLQVNISF